MAAARIPRTTRARPSSVPVCYELADCSTLTIPAAYLIPGARPSSFRARETAGQASRLAAQFIRQNRPNLDQIGATIAQRYDGTSVSLDITSTTKVGAVPLLSPTTGRPDYGLVVRPRFEWSGLGPMLGDMGWRVIPQPLALPMLPRSERKIPPWVLSTMILFRIEAMLKHLERRFEMIEEERAAPRGSVDWTRYATQQMPRAQFLNVPCRFPDLRDDRHLKAAIRFALNKQLFGLEGQRSAGVFVIRLMELCQSLLERVRDVAPREPAPREIEAWLHGPLRTDSFRAGLQAVEWTVGDRGLAGLSDLQGLPWVMAMEEFFEAWCEAVISNVARRIGGTLKTGRQRQTVAPISWVPAYLGSQKSLVPDLVLERGDTTYIIDAKYKEHWEELSDRGWRNVEDELRERHRADLLQVLAYANLAKTTRIVACLAYPCKGSTWKSLKERGQQFHRASIPAGERRLDVLLTAFPMGERIETVAADLAAEFARS